MYLRKRIITTLIVTVTLMLVIGFSYAKFIMKEVEGNNNYNTIVSGTTGDNGLNPNFVVTYLEGDQLIDTGSIVPEYQELVRFKVSTTNTTSQKLMIRLDTILNTATSGTYTLYSCNETNYNSATLSNVGTNCTNIGSGTLFPFNTIKKIHTDSYLTLNESSTNYYALAVNTTSVTLRYKGLILVKSYYDNSLENMIYSAYTPVSDAIASTYVTAADGINFAAISSPTNGQGLYINDKNSGSGDIKYFRGGTYCAYTGWNNEFMSGPNCRNAGGTWNSSNYRCSLHEDSSLCASQAFTYYELNNNVMFAGFAWKIIRINANGSIRMIYNGTTPYDRDENSVLNFSLRYFYSSHTTAVSVQYSNSALKSNTDTWYANNLVSYNEYLSDQSFCNDLTFDSGSSGYYKPYTRRTAPTYNCPLAYDYSVSNTKLTVPIGAITSDELFYAGKINDTLYTFVDYLSNGVPYWTMSPCKYDSANSYYRIMYQFERGGVSDTFSSSTSVYARPVINLKGDTLVTGTGSLSDPWVVQTN